MSGTVVRPLTAPYLVPAGLPPWANVAEKPKAAVEQHVIEPVRPGEPGVLVWSGRGPVAAFNSETEGAR